MNYKVILNLIKSDLIMLNGGKHSFQWLTGFMCVFFGFMGFVASPLGGIYIPVMIGTYFVQMLFQNEVKYHSERMFSLLPIERKDLVQSRFLLVTGFYTILTLLFYLLMLLSLHLKLYMGTEGMADIISMMAEKMGFSEVGFFNLIYLFATAMGLYMCSSQLRKYFKDNKAFELNFETVKPKKANIRELIAGILVISGLVLFVMLMTGMLPVLPALLLILQILLQLAQAADGVLLGAVLIAIALMQMIYSYVSTLLEYEKKEL